MVRKYKTVLIEYFYTVALIPLLQESNRILLEIRSSVTLSIL